MIQDEFSIGVVAEDGTVERSPKSVFSGKMWDAPACGR